MTEYAPKTIIGVIGGHTHNTVPEAMAFAEAVGEELARRDLAVVCGGLDGIMESVCKGAKRAGGVTLGVLKGNHAGAANSCIDYAVATSMDVASNNIIVWTASAIIAFDGRYGTLNEMALALDFGKPLIATGHQRLLNVDAVDSKHFVHYPGYDHAAIPRIVDHMLEMIEESQS